MPTGISFSCQTGHLQQYSWRPLPPLQCHKSSPCYNRYHTMLVQRRDIPPVNGTVSNERDYLDRAYLMDRSVSRESAHAPIGLLLRSPMGRVANCSRGMNKL